MTDTPSTSDPGAGHRVEHTPEEVAAFEERAETVGQYADLMAANLNAEREEAAERIDAARTAGRSESELRNLRSREQNRLNTLLYALLAVVIVLIAAYMIFFSGGEDTLAGIDGSDTVASDVAEIAPPEPADTPEEVLPAAVFTYTCEDCGDTDVTQVPLDLNKDAKYQYAYEADGARLAIFTVVEAAKYDELVSTFEYSQEAAAAEGEEPEPPIEIEDVGDKAVIYGGSVIFTNGEDCAVISGMPKQNVEGEQYMSLSPEELERLARIAAPRM